MSQLNLNNHFTHSITQSNKRVLMLGHDTVTSRSVKSQLKHCGFTVFETDSREAGLSLIRKEGLPHIALIEVAFSDSFCKTLKQFSDVPIIALIDPNSSQHNKTFKNYAEDTIIKPIRPLDLIARIQRVLQRTGQFTYPLENRIVVDEYLTIELGKLQVQLFNKTVDLTPIENKILYLLMQNAGQLVPSRVLLSRVWHLESGCGDSLQLYIQQLREKLAIDTTIDDKKKPYIQIEHGVGYCFQPPRLYCC